MPSVSSMAAANRLLRILGDMTMRRRLTAPAVAAVLAAVMTASCGTPPPASPAAAMATALAKLNAAHSFSFTFTAGGTPPADVTAATQGSGEVVRPASFSGTFLISVAGVPISIGIIETPSGSFIKAPFSQTYVRGNAREYGFPDPSDLFSRETGIPRLLAHTVHLSYGGEKVTDGVTEWIVTGLVPNGYFSSIVETPHVSIDDPITYGIQASDGELRTMVISAPIYVRSSSEPLSVDVGDYNAPFDITAP